ncbi:MAG: S1C family serine protease [Pirellulaceae bacterium]|jgi:S1-C subfamily serine protease|nr:S1C family serine protease [Pirellulaceae bacterium]
MLRRLKSGLLLASGLTASLLASAGTLAIAQEAAAPEAKSTADESSWEMAARKLQVATVTVRIWTGAAAAEGAIEAEAAATPETAPPQAVTVCSGICVREGSVITAAMAGSDSTIRLTLAGGKQANAKLQVIDEFSGLALLKCDADPGEPLELAAAAPAVGGGVMSASAWGVEQPLVSLGIVAGTERQRAGSQYPPLLQCDLRTTDTSSGAGVVDRQGKLVGVIVAADSPESKRGWAYAIPVSHVERLLRTADEQRQSGVTIIKRRRPVAGLRIDQVDEGLVVVRVFPDGPAEKAGVKLGDRVIATDGVEIRSAYQALRPTYSKQPGDTLTLRIERDGKQRDLQIVLGGGVEVASAPLEMLSGLMQPKVEIVREGNGYISRRSSGTIREVFQPPLPTGEPPPAGATPADKIALLEKALVRYQAVIEYQQRQLVEEQKKQLSHEEQLRNLQRQIEALRQPAPATGRP